MAKLIVTAEGREKIIKLSALGLTDGEIGQRLGVSLQRIQQLRKLMGVPSGREQRKAIADRHQATDVPLKTPSENVD